MGDAMTCEHPAEKIDFRELYFSKFRMPCLPPQKANISTATEVKHLERMIGVPAMIVDGCIVHHMTYCGKVYLYTLFKSRGANAEYWIAKAYSSLSLLSSLTSSGICPNGAIEGLRKKWNDAILDHRVVRRDGGGYEQARRPETEVNAIYAAIETDLTMVLSAELEMWQNVAVALHNEMNGCGDDGADKYEEAYELYQIE